MKKGARFLGHSIHPILIVFPLGLLATGTIFDLLYRFLDNPVFATVAFWMILAGIVGGLVSALFGWIDWIDWLAIEAETRAKRIGLAHGVVNTVVLILFAASLYLRYGAPERPSMPATILVLAGAAISLIGGWLGGELVERLGIGVHPGANPNAPSSLSSESVIAVNETE